MFNATKDFLKIIRWPNLIIIFATLWLVKVCIFQSQLNALSIVFPISNLDLFLCSFAAILIAAAGYIINDVIDKEADKINKPHKSIDFIAISEQRLRQIYWVLNILSFIPTIIVFKGKSIYLFVIIQGLVICSLFFYTKTLKGKGLVGNFSIAMLSSLFPLGLWFLVFLSPGYAQLSPEIDKRVLLLSAFYSCFAFLLSFIREIVKDLEDREGDKKANYKTFALTHHEAKVKRLIFWLLVFFIGLIFVFQIYLKQIGYPVFSASFTIHYVLLFVFVFPLLKRAKSSIDYHQISFWLKILMVLGILFMLYLLT